CHHSDHYTIVLLHLFFFNNTPTTKIYTLSLHDALPIYLQRTSGAIRKSQNAERRFERLVCATNNHQTEMHDRATDEEYDDNKQRSEEHTSELQSRGHLVCRLLLEKKKKNKKQSRKQLKK